MKKLISLSIILIILLMNASIAFAQPPALDAGAYILMDLKSGEVLCEKDSQKTFYPASTTKIMTAILALEMGDLNHVMTASQSAIDDIGEGGSNIGIIPGEKIKLENLLQALLISSANETANIIAENLCKSRDEFISLMNRRAKELGATNTNFINTCGIHDPMHYTTAYDMAKIARHAMTLPKFREIVSTASYQMPVTNKHSEWPVLSNTNKLMITDKNELYKINGIKTGYTGPAGCNLVSSASGSNGMELIAVVMSVKNENASENVRTYTKELLDYGFNNFKWVNLLEKDKVYRNVKVEGAADTYGLDLIPSESLDCILPKAEALRNIKEIPHIMENISAPVNEGDIMGYVEFFKDDVSIGRINLLAARYIEHKPEPVTLTVKIKNALDSFLARVILFTAGFILFFIILRTTLKHISRRVHARR